MEEVNILGLMADIMKEIMKMIKSMVLEYMFGQVNAFCNNLKLNISKID